MRKLLVRAVIVGLCLAIILPSGALWAQAPVQADTPAPLNNRDLTPYVIGAGAILGVIAFNLAAPPAAAWLTSAGRAASNVTAVATALRSRVAGTFVGAGPRLAASAAPAARTAAAGAAAAPRTPMLVPPLTSSMLAQVQIGGISAAMVGALVAHWGYQVAQWATGEAY